MDSIFHTYDNIWKNDSLDCWNTIDGSFMGKTIVIGKDGFDVFLNKAGDSIKINRNAHLHDSWTFYEGDTLIFLASIIKHDTMHFLDQLDSVKTIELKSFDTAMNPIPHSMNSGVLYLSQNYGLIRAPFFRVFPDFIGEMHEMYDPGYFITAGMMNMIGITNPDIGFQDLSTFDVFDFNVGDELHIKDYTDARHNPTSYWLSTEVRTRINYLARNDYLPDSIVYTVMVRRRRIEHWKDSSVNVYSSNIEKQKIIPDSDLDQPAETYVNGDQFYLSEDGKTKTLSDIHSSLWGLGTCITSPIADGCYSTMTYRKGLGGPYHSCENTISYLEKLSRELVYFRKENDEWGRPFTDVGIEEVQIESVKIYPNPASSEIKVVFARERSARQVQIEVYNLMGALIYSQPTTVDIANSMVILNIADLPNGSYLLHCSSPPVSWKGRFEIIR